MHEQGVTVSQPDDAEMARRRSTSEAAKAILFGGYRRGRPEVRHPEPN